MYTLGGKWKERKRQRKAQRKAKEQLRQVIIPDEAFYADADYLPKFDEVRIQEELSNFYDPTSITLASEYARFKYSMGGNLKMYDDHIALSSPKRKIKKPSYSPYKHGTSYDSLKLESSAENTLDTFNDTMEIPGKHGRLNGHGDDLDFGTSQLRASFENLDISDMPGNVFASSESRSSRKSAFKNEGFNTEDCSKPDYLDSKDRDYSPIRNETKVQERSEDYSLTASKTDDRKRDYSPMHDITGFDKGTAKGETTKGAPESSADGDDQRNSCRSDTNKDNNSKVKTTKRAHESSAVGDDRKNSCRSDTNKDTNSKVEPWRKDASKQGDARGDVKVFESMTRYDRTLNYVNQQNRTIQNGDYNGLDVDLSDLSSDVFTDSEVPVTLPDSGNWSHERLDKDFYPDSPTSEFAFSKTPCSSRKNSVESLLSDESVSDKETKGTPRTTTLQHKVISISKTNGVANGTSRVTPKGAPVRNGKTTVAAGKKPEIKNVKSKVGSMNNTSYKPGGGRGKITVKKTDYKNAKSKVDSFGNFHHIPGGGQGKIPFKPINNYKSVEPRTDTHSIEAYSNLPVEFQEIARRLARQDKDLRDHTSTSGSSSGGRSRPRSRLSSRSSRGGSLSPTDRTPTKPNNHTKGLSSNLSASAVSLTSTGTPKKRRPISRTPSLHSRPFTPSLSRTHPATYCTPYDSRSRPHSRPTSRSTSPIRSRNSSPQRGRRSRTSSPNRRSRNPSPARGKHSRCSSPSRKHSDSQGKRSRGSSKEKTLSGKPPSRSPSRSRLDSRPTTPVMDILSISAGSVFQVIPVNR